MRTRTCRLHCRGAALVAVVCVLSLLLAGCGASPDGVQDSAPAPDGAGPAEVSEPVVTPEPADDAGPSDAAPAEDAPLEEAPALELPLLLEDGKLEVSSLFRYSGMNPDCGLEEGEDIASLSFTNTAQAHLASVLFTVVLTDGTEYHFAAADVPAGTNVMAFETGNAAYDGSVPCASVTCSAVFEDSAPLMEEALTVSVDGIAVTLTNQTGGDLENLVIDCHTLFDGSCFGGLTYSYPVECVTAGGSVTLQAEDCFLGEALVARITQGG